MFLPKMYVIWDGDDTKLQLDSTVDIWIHLLAKFGVASNSATQRRKQTFQHLDFEG